FHGFPPIKAKNRTAWLERLRHVGGTAVFFEAPHRIRQTLEALRSRLGDCHVVVARELTKIHEELVRGPISDALEQLENPRGAFMAKQLRPQPRTTKTSPQSPSARTARKGESAAAAEQAATSPVPGGPQRRSTYFEAVALYERGLEALQRHEYQQASSILESVL